MPDHAIGSAAGLVNRPLGVAPLRRSSLEIAQAWAATWLLVALCLWPRALLPAREEGPRLIPHADKLVHFGMFALFGAAWMRATPGLPSRRRRAGIVAAGVVLAVATELGQATPWVGRDPDVLDALADVAGVVVGVTALGGRRADGGERPRRVS